MESEHFVALFFYSFSVNFLNPLAATMIPRINRAIAKASCNKSPAILVEIPAMRPEILVYMVMLNADKVTHNIIHIGIQIILPLRFVFLRNTAQAMRARALNN